MHGQALTSAPLTAPRRPALAALEACQLCYWPPRLLLGCWSLKRTWGLLGSSSVLCLDRLVPRPGELVGSICMSKHSFRSRPPSG